MYLLFGLLIVSLHHRCVVSLNEPDDDLCTTSGTQNSMLYMNPALPFIVLEPLFDLDEYNPVRDKMQNDINLEPTNPGKLRQNIWCEGIMFSEVWGIAPPSCLLFNMNQGRNQPPIGKFYLNFIEEATNANISYITTAQIFLPPGYTKIDDFYCDFIALFQIQNYKFNFNNIVLLPSLHDRRDLSEVVHVCRVIGAKLNTDHAIQMRSATFALADTSDFCNAQRGECAPLQCRNYNFNVTYLRLDVPKTHTDQHCRMDTRYHGGSSLMCQTLESPKWTYYGMASWELISVCNAHENTDGYQGFTRVDAYMNWIVETVSGHGGFTPAKALS